jgi:putative membrane protein
MKSLKTRLYGVQDPSATARQKKFIEVITGLGGIIIVGWLALKFLFPQVGEVKADFLGTISFIGMVFFGNLITLGMVVVMILPYSLYGYYRNKYSEEYREFEGKSLEEWYGKKYLKKHKELLEGKNEEIDL